MWTGRENPWEGDGKDSGILREGHPRRTLPSKSPHPSQNLHIAFPPPKRPPAFQPIPVASPNCLLPAREGYGKAKLKLAIRQCSRDEARRRREGKSHQSPSRRHLALSLELCLIDPPSSLIPHPSPLQPGLPDASPTPREGSHFCREAIPSPLYCPALTNNCQGVINHFLSVIADAADLLAAYQAPFKSVGGPDSR